MNSQRQRAWRDRRDGHRAVLAVACLMFVIAFSSFVRTGAPAGSHQPAPAQQADDDEIYTGSILFMPYQGNQCRQHLLDNLSGRVWDNGVVDCENAMARAAGPQTKTWSAARVDAIRDGFARR